MPLDDGFYLLQQIFQAGKQGSQFVQGLRRLQSWIQAYGVPVKMKLVILIQPVYLMISSGCFRRHLDFTTGRHLAPNGPKLTVMAAADELVFRC